MKYKKISDEYQRDSEGRVIFNMTVKDDSDFLSVFSQSETPVISSEVAEFIENSVQSIGPKESLTLKIHSDCIDDREKLVYEGAIRKYYQEKQVSHITELHRNYLLSLLLLIFGVIILAASVLLSYNFKNDVLPEVVDIVAWVLVWESVDISLFKNGAIRFASGRCKMLSEMKIEYCDISKTQ